jgi:hypothetical protein
VWKARDTRHPSLGCAPTVVFTPLRTSLRWPRLAKLMNLPGE